MGPLRFMAAGNFSPQDFSSSARNDEEGWRYSDLWRQETIRPEISRLRFALLEMTGRYGTIVM